MLIDRGHLIRFIEIWFNQNNISINSYVENTQTIQIKQTTIKSSNNTQKYFITEA